MLRFDVVQRLRLQPVATPRAESSLTHGALLLPSARVRRPNTGIPFTECVGSRQSFCQREPHVYRRPWPSSPSCLAARCLAASLRHQLMFCGKFRMLLRHALSFCCMITRHCWLCLQQCCIQAWPGSKHGAAARHAETGPESGLGRRRTGTFGQGRITRPRSLFRSNFPTCWIWSSVVYCSCTSNPKITPRDGQTATSTQAQLADCHAFGAS